MKLSDFDFELPSNLIAQNPAYPRDTSKMLVINQNKFVDQRFFDLPNYITKNDLIICNNTKVLASRLEGSRNNTSIQITLHKKNNNETWHAFAKPAKKLKINDQLKFKSLNAKIIDKLEMGEIIIKFDCNNNELLNKLSAIGSMPLPPYIKRKISNEYDDNLNYQTVYAKNLGAVAAPTAGLHFTNEILKKLIKNKINIDYVTLHVGAGTFLPVKSEEINNHKMHSEWGEVSHQVVEKITACKRNGGKIISIGTTTLRILETAFDTSTGKLKPFSGNTNIFIKPGYNFNSTDILLTNFHLPKSTLLMLVYAFGGIENIKSAYKYAIENKYRFFSYGDCCLIRKSQ